MDDDIDIFRDMNKRIERMMKEIFEPLEEDLYNFERKELRPLIQIMETDDEVIVSIDMPCVRKEDIEIRCSEDILYIKAKMRECIRLEYITDKEFEQYSRSIRLPTSVEPKEAKATFSNGILQVRLQKKRRGNEIKVE